MFVDKKCTEDYQRATAYEKFYAVMVIEGSENLERSLCLAFHSVKIRKEPRKESGLGIVTDRNYP